MLVRGGREKVPTQDDLAYLTLDGSTAGGLAFSPNGELLASTASGGEITLWETRSGKIHRTLSPPLLGGHDWGRSPEFAAGGTQVVGDTTDGRIIQWDIQREKCLKVLNVGGRLTALSLVRDGAAVLALTEDHETPDDMPGWPSRLQLIDLATGTIKKYAFPRHVQVRSMGVAAASNEIWLGDGGGFLTILRLDNLAFVRRSHVEGGATHVAISKSGAVAVTCGGREIALWDAVTRTRRRELQANLEINALALSADGTTVAVGGGPANCCPGAYQLFETTTGQPICSFRLSGGPAHLLSLSPDGQVLATAGWTDRTIRLFRLRDLRHLPPT
jgi:WD40 repeat protein